MIDITKEEFWDEGYVEVNKTKENNNIIIQLIKNHKFIAILLIALTLLITVNTVLIYNFFKILTSI